MRTKAAPKSKRTQARKLSGRKPAKVYPYQSVESQFLSEHCKEMEQYPGEWLLIHGYRLVAHSPDFFDIERAIQGERIQSPFIHYVPRPEEVNFVA